MYILEDFSILSFVFGYIEMELERFSLFLYISFDLINSMKNASAEHGFITKKDVLIRALWSSQLVVMFSLEIEI